MLIIFSPGYSSDSMLSLMGVRLKLILQIEKYQFIEYMKMGGISIICNVHKKARDKCVNPIILVNHQHISCT